MAENKNKIGEAYVEYTADTAKLEAGAAKADAAFKQTAQGAAQAGKAVGDEIGKGTEQAAKGFAKMGAESLSSVGKVVGMFTRAAGIIGIVTTALAGLAVGAKKAWDSLVDLGVNAEKTGIRLSDPMERAFKKVINNVTELQKLGKVPFLNPESMELDRKSVEALQKAIDDFKAKFIKGKDGVEGPNLLNSGVKLDEYKDNLSKLAGIKQRHDAAMRKIEEANEEVAIEASRDRQYKIMLEGLSEREKLTIQYGDREAEMEKAKEEAINKNRLTLAAEIDAEIQQNRDAFTRQMYNMSKKAAEDAARDARQTEIDLMDERTQIAEKAEDKIAAIKEKIIGKNKYELGAAAVAEYERQIEMLNRLKDKQLADYDKKQKEQRDKEIKEAKEKEERIAKDKLRINEELQRKMEDQSKGYQVDNIVQSINAMNANLAEVIRTSAR